jgi:hypothetical protein
VRNLDQEVRRYLAWQSIVKDVDALNLDTHQRRQAAESEKRADETVGIRLQTAYCWVLVPGQEGTGPWTWTATRLPGSHESCVVRAARQLRGDEQLIARWSPALLRMELDGVLWKDAAQPHLNTATLWDYFATYGYLPRLLDVDVLSAAIIEGLRSRDYFAYATSVGPDGRYQGLVFGDPTFDGPIHVDRESVLVKPEAALRQLEADRAREAPPRRAADDRPGGGEPGQEAHVPPGHETTRVAAERAAPRRFHASVELEPTRLSTAAAQIGDEIVQHLAALLHGDVRVTLEIEARTPDGFPDSLVRTITENANALKFKAHAFEDE